ncbi:MAG: trypsin-like peptidase domain-containing protein [Candidatus Limnocylindrales bacterium]
MSAYDPNEPCQTRAEPERPMNADWSRPAETGPLWQPEALVDESSEPAGGPASAAPNVPLPPYSDPGQPDAASPLAQPLPWSVPTGMWTPPPAPPIAPPAAAPYGGAPGYFTSGFEAPQPPAPPEAGEPYYYWAPPGGVPPTSGGPKQQSPLRRLGPLVVAVALLSGSLSAVGTYVAVTLASSSGPAAATATSQPGSAQTISLTQSDAIIRVASLVKPSVVTIVSSDASGVSPFSVPSTGAGSGFIVSSNGLILTNNHVVTGASSLTVTLDDTRQMPATVVTTDATHDLALIKIDATGLTPVTLGDSAGVQVGQLAIAIGSPLGTFTDSVTQGIVSGVNRSITVGDQATRTQEDLSGLIQTDAAINPGNSGGPLLDASGTVVGIITATASNAQDMGFAIPINQAKQMIAQATK